MDEAIRADYVERWARILEAQGESRIAGRIFAQLITADSAHLSLNELAEELGVSRASVSVNTRRLIEVGLISRVAVPGSRREHYAADPDAARGMIARAAVASRALEALAREGLGLRTDDGSRPTETLRVMADLYGRLAETMELSAHDSASDRPRTR